MRRREFITFLSGAAVTWPLVTRAQAPTMSVIGYLHGASPGPNADMLAAFQQGLAEAGYVEGKNVVIEYRWAENRYDQLPAMAADLAGRRVAVIYATGGTITALAAKAATTTIPIVFRIGADPVKAGLVASFNRPGGNVTGVTVMTDLVIVKRFELLSDLLLPTARLISVLLNSSNPNFDARSGDLQVAARLLGRQINILTASDEAGLDTAFASLVQQPTDALLVQSDPFFYSQRDRLAALAARYAVPAIYEQREYAVAGGLLSYGADFADSDRRAAGYVAKILKGEKPADLPVWQPSKFDLVINLKTAKALGLTIPPTLIARADDVIQ
jgi:putative ABC transport system substrate-binding protein